MTRQQTLDFIKTHPDISVLVVGGGINGISTFRELALQGVDVLLVEMNDFSSGASAGSSHMLHGGIRYLENGEFRLVREALHERNLMLQNAPHYTAPLPTSIPIYKNFSGLLNAPLKFVGLSNRTGERGALVIKMGLMMYDFFVRNNRITPTHEFYSRERVRREFPKMNKDVRYVARYYDGWMPYPERICLELIMDAEGENAHAINYMKMVRGESDIVTLEDRLTGETYTVKPKLVINAAGPWIDFANRNMNQTTNFIGGTKGSHLIVDHPELREAIGNSEIFFENDDGRIVLLCPYMDRVMMGTTDIPIENPDDAVCTDEEIAYILDLASKVFPDIHVKRSDVVFTFSGVRPLPTSDADNPGQVSRDHSIKVTAPDDKVKYPVYSLVGGKWTSQRAFGEQTADKALGYLGVPRKVDTKHRKFGGGVDYPETEADRNRWLLDIQQKTELEKDHLKRLFERYGTYAEKVAMYIADGNDQPLQHYPDYTVREIQFLAEHEKVEHLMDVLLRRTLLAMLGRLTKPMVQEIAEAMAVVKGWSDERTAEEIQKAHNALRVQHLTELG
jgi:glycerol-3-phosphate dehydrogenase